MAFSIHDRDNDRSGANCAQIHSAGWWYKNCECAGLNGHNGNNHWYGFTNSHKSIEMKLRSRD